MNIIIQLRTVVVNPGWTGTLEWLLIGSKNNLIFKRRRFPVHLFSEVQEMTMHKTRSLTETLTQPEQITTTTI